MGNVREITLLNQLHFRKSKALNSGFIQVDTSKLPLQRPPRPSNLPFTRQHPTTSQFHERTHTNHNLRRQHGSSLPLHLQNKPPAAHFHFCFNLHTLLHPVRPKRRLLPLYPIPNQQIPRLALRQGIRQTHPKVNTKPHPQGRQDSAR